MGPKVIFHTEAVAVLVACLTTVGCGRRAQITSDAEADMAIPSLDEVLRPPVGDGGSPGAGGTAPGGFIASMQDQPARVSVDCGAPTRTGTGRASLRCHFNMVSVSPPRHSADEEKSLAALRATIVRRGAEVLAQACPDLAKYDGGGVEEIVMTGPMRKACAAKDVNAYADAFVSGTRELETDVCDTFLNDWEDEYEQIDANTWIANKGPEGICRASSNMTIWRADSHAPWSYKQVMSTPPNATGPFCQPGTIVVDYAGGQSRPRSLPCKYVRM
jgi:hypothetical protein